MCCAHAGQLLFETGKWGYAWSRSFCACISVWLQVQPRFWQRIQTHGQEEPTEHARVWAKYGPINQLQVNRKWIKYHESLGPHDEWVIYMIHDIKWIFIG